MYDIVLLGATGYTGAQVAKYLATHLSETHSWAIAGRTSSKLRRLVSSLQPWHPTPAIEVVDLDADSLLALARTTRVLINAIGPYSRYGELVIAACTAAGVGYVDFSTETPWIADMIAKYGKVADDTGAVIIPAIGNISSPSDLLAYALASYLSKEHGVPTEKIVSSQELVINGMSSGSLSSLLAVASKYGVENYLRPNPHLLTAESSPTEASVQPVVVHHPTLGHLTRSVSAPGNIAAVHRSALRAPELFSPTFTFQEWMPAKSRFQAILVSCLTVFAFRLISFRPVLYLLQRFLPQQPSSGPPKEAGEGESIDVKGIATSAQDPDGARYQAVGRYSYRGSMYFHSAMLAAEAAMALVDEMRSDGDADGKLKPTTRARGFLTPSYLGRPFINRVCAAGVQFEIEEGTRDSI
ncbi:uncharacterized protein HMPREF1541_03126 [Cyphellophora europaea CBS 101466]|uniref:Saccharopine dehydrogenase NADP binding domain-containing protein n=1 Tax=Cyphellophora europaea (strain CBS 101466) TaxID=1220924 RepID=W2RXE2_CYPE1|nr:uncharacterized protein HMPREF1541_03126 [Cyphellophora europaea CBS 101466]ETN41191.1 hypothetical protein HMPREF1541_03126 [Cyphellophora europaea CBS 101466]